MKTTSRSDETGRKEQAMSTGGFSNARLGRMHDVMAMIETFLLSWRFVDNWVI